MEIEEIILLIIGLSIFAKYIIYDGIIAIKQEINRFPEYLISIIANPIFQIFFVVISIIGIILLTIWLHNLFIKKAKKKEEKIREFESEEKSVRDLLDKNIRSLDIEELEAFVNDLENFNISDEVLKPFEKELKTKLEDTKGELKVKKRRETLYEISRRKEEIKEEINELRKKRYEEELKSKDNERAILEHLNADENDVFELDNLNEKEIKVLKKEGFKEINEYCPILNENRNFLVKQILNHSPTHTFLVGRIKQLLEQYLEHTQIQVHDTKDTDITFEVDYNIYAFEIETGTLLRKKEQLKEKVNYLNKKYGKTWYFVVSNRNLIKKYKEYGKCIQRAGVRKLIEKLTDF